MDDRECQLTDRRQPDSGSNPALSNIESARVELRRAMALHASGEITSAIAASRRAIELAPEYAEAHAYLGNTLVARKRQFADGLKALELATTFAPKDAAILYTCGWCHEYVANALERNHRSPQTMNETAPTLYASARKYLFRALDAGPDDQLRGDIEDMLDVIADATGEPWENDSQDL